MTEMLKRKPTSYLVLIGREAAQWWRKRMKASLGPFEFPDQTCPNPKTLHTFSLDCHSPLGSNKCHSGDPPQCLLPFVWTSQLTSGALQPLERESAYLRWNRILLPTSNSSFSSSSSAFAIVLTLTNVLNPNIIHILPRQPVSRSKQF